MTENSDKRANPSPARMTAGEWSKVRGLLHEMIAQVSPQYRSKFDASDIVQQTLLEACDTMEDFRGKTDAELASWLRRMLSHNLLDAVRKLRSHKRSVSREIRLELSQSGTRKTEAVRLESDQTSPSMNVAKHEEASMMVEAIKRLPADQQEAITLHHLQGWSTTEVAAKMNRSRAAVAGLLHRGLKALRNEMNEDQKNE